MKNYYDPKKHHRRSIRLKDYDYSQEGLYFITICVQNKICLFGHIESGKMILNEAGEMVEKEWLKIPERFANTVLHEYVVMPNHFHAIIEIVGAIPCGYPNSGVLTGTKQHQNEPNKKNHPPINKRLGDMVGAFQSIITVEYIRGVKTLGWERFNKKLLQRNYWEHIIRNLNSFSKIAHYITTNPENWETDKFYP